MPDKDTLDFVTTLIKLTIEDDTLSTWEKFKFIAWLFYVTAPHIPRPF